MNPSFFKGVQVDWSRIAGLYDDEDDQIKPYNGFDLSNCLIDRSEIITPGPVKGGIPPIHEPIFAPADKADQFMGDDDLVIGVAWQGEAKAYPICILESHECINDQLAGKPLAVTYNPLCQSALVFDRQFAEGVRRFSNSCLIWNGASLLYDKQDNPADESLFSQVGMQALSGAALKNGDSLQLLPSKLTTWGAWRRFYPSGQILTANTGYRYNYNPRFSQFSRYYQDDKIVYQAAAKVSGPADMAPKESVLVVSIGEAARLYRISEIAHFSEDQPAIDQIGAQKIQLFMHPQLATPTAKVAAKDGEIATGRCFWFAASAQLPAAKLVSLSS
jgi:hypothetical protein